MRQLSTDPWNTNTFLTALPKSLGMSEALEQFNAFGEVSSWRPLRGGICVSFYDIRCAWYAIQMLGEKYCTPAKQHGERIVHLAPDVTLTDVDLACVSNILEQDDGTVSVEFFDTRVAERMKKAEEARMSPQEQVEPPPGLESYQRPSTGCVGPAYVSTASMKAMPKHSTNHAATPSRDLHGQQQIVLIKGLPKALLSEKCIEAMFQQAGLQDAIISVSTTHGEPCGEALVTLRTLKHAELCMNHCQGRCWDPAGKTKVEVMLVPKQSSESEDRRLGAEASRSKARRSKVSTAKPRNRMRSDTVESCTNLSTDVGESDNDETVF
jgi:hypothetical protein